MGQQIAVDDVYLVVSSQDNYVHIHQLEMGETLIGRGKCCHLILPDPLVSRVHASILKNDTEIRISDLKSRNGTRVAGQRIRESPIVSGTKIEIGPYELLSVTGCCEALKATSQVDSSTRTGQCQVRRRPDVDRLTPTQRRVYDGFLSGCSEKEVAHSMGISIHTVHSHAKRIYATLSVCSRAELMAQSLPNDLAMD